MTEKINISSIFSTMDMLLLEQKEDRSFRLLGDIPKWVLCFEALSKIQLKQFYPERLFNFLEGFIEQNQPFWNTGHDVFEKKKSSWWTEIDKSHNTHYLQATAVSYKIKKYLIIEHATNTSEIFGYLQKYKENMVTFETPAGKEHQHAYDTGSLPDLSLIDHVTGLHNNKAFFLLAKHQQRMGKRKKIAILVSMLDINDIHLIKEKYGDREVNAALVDAANILKQTFRKTDVIGKLDEGFAVLALETTEDGEKTIFLRLKKNLDAYNKISFKTYDIDFNIGFVKFDADYTGTLEEAVKVAGFRLIENKKAAKIL